MESFVVLCVLAIPAVLLALVFGLALYFVVHASVLTACLVGTAAGAYRTVTGMWVFATGLTDSPRRKRLPKMFQPLKLVGYLVIGVPWRMARATRKAFK